MSRGRIEDLSFREHTYAHGLRHVAKKTEAQIDRERAARRAYYRDYSQRLADTAAVMREPRKSLA